MAAKDDWYFESTQDAHSSDSEETDSSYLDDGDDCEEAKWGELFNADALLSSGNAAEEASTLPVSTFLRPSRQSETNCRASRRLAASPRASNYDVPRPSGQNYDVPRPSGQNYQVPRTRRPEETGAKSRCHALAPNFEALCDMSDHKLKDRAASCCEVSSLSLGEDYEEIDLVCEQTVRPKKKGVAHRAARLVSRGLRGPAAGLAKLGNQLAGMRDLGQNFKSMLNLRDDDTREEETEEGYQARETPEEAERLAGHVPAPVHLLQSPDAKSARNVYTLFIDGPMGCGKSTLIRSIHRLLTGTNVACFREPMDYWRGVFSDCIDNVYRLTSKRASLRNSASLLAVQTKFLTPMRALQDCVNRCSLDGNNSAQTTSLDSWALFDRHVISASVVFPLVFLKRGILSFEHFMGLLSMFRADEGDVIVLLSLDDEEACRRLKRRNRKSEQGITRQYIRDLRDAYHKAYCAWLLLRQLGPVGVAEICVKTATMHGVCARTSGLRGKVPVMEKLWSKSLFMVIADVIEPFNTNAALMQIVYAVACELNKLEFLVVDATKFTDDVPGLWTDIYMQTLRTPSIKTRVLDWTYLTAIARDFSK